MFDHLRELLVLSLTPSDPVVATLAAAVAELQTSAAGSHAMAGHAGAVRVAPSARLLR